MKRDGRKLDHGTLEEIRKMAIGGSAKNLSQLDMDTIMFKLNHCPYKRPSFLTPAELLNRVALRG